MFWFCSGLVCEALQAGYFVLRLKQLKHRNLITVEKGERMLFTEGWLKVEMHVNSEIRENV